MRKDLILPKLDPSEHFRKALEETLREGARQLLQQAIENEVQEFFDEYRESRTKDGQLSVVRNGYLPKRLVQTGVGSIPIHQPRVRDREKKRTFSSAILPPYMRRTLSIESVVSALYLQGISTNNFPEAQEAILGENAKGLSPTNIVRLKEGWENEFKDWNNSDLSGKHFVYFWADGIYFNIRLDDDRPCLLVIIGALSNGSKELVAIYDGCRESKISWSAALNDLKRRGLTISPSLAIGDGRWAFGLLSKKYSQRQKLSAAGYIRQQTSWTRCQKASKNAQKQCFMKYSWHRRRRLPCGHSTPL